MALNAYLTIKGQRQGTIKGSVTQKGREDSILVRAVSHDVASPRDPKTGLQAGPRTHKPLVVRKEIDRASPQLWSALTDNENLVEVVLRFWRPTVVARTGAGSEEQHYTITLTDANIASIGTRMPNNGDPELQKIAEYEEIALTYQKITWTWTDGGISAQDQWDSSAR